MSTYDFKGAVPVNLSTIGFLMGATSQSASTPSIFTATTTGSGNVFALATSPTLVTPVLGVATATSINGLTITSSTGTLTIAAAKVLTANASLTLAGTDSTVMTFPATSTTVAGLGIAQSFTAQNTFDAGTLTTSQPLTITQTWNAGGTTFGGFKLAIANTASAAASLPFQILGGAAGATVLVNMNIAGNVGVGTATLTEKLNVNGNILLPLGNAVRFGADTIQVYASSPGYVIFEASSVFQFNAPIVTFSGVTSSFPALVRSGTALQVKLADNTAGGTLQVTGTLRIDQAPTTNSSAATTITNGADSSSNCGHRISINMNGTTYWIPCSSVAF